MKKMKNIYALMAATAVLSLGSCIEETFPESDTATAEQVSESPSALEGTVNGISSQMVQGYLVYGEQEHETDMGYPQFMIANTEMLGDMYPGGSNSGYDWYRSYNTMQGNSDRSYLSFLPWRTLYMFVKTANSIISNIDVNDESLSDEMRYYAGAAYADRAFQYFNLMVYFEPVENKYTNCSGVKGLTVPIVTEKTTEDEAKNNPRATHEQMMEFILNDLNIADRMLEGNDLAAYGTANRMVPCLAVSYGIRAKVLLWDGQYAEAAK